MADKEISNLPELEGLTDDTLIPVYQPGAQNPAQSMTGAQFREFAEAAGLAGAEPVISVAQDAANRAETAAERAESVKSVSECFSETIEASSNRLDQSAATTGYYVNPNSGTLASNSSYATSDFIPVSAGEIITYQYGQKTVYEGRTIGTISFLAAYDEGKNYVSGDRNITSYTVPDGAAYIRISTTGLASGDNVAVVASAEKVDYEEYGPIYRYVLKPEAHDGDYIREIAESVADENRIDDDHIRDIAKEVVDSADIKSDEVWAAPIVVGVTASRFEFDVPSDTKLLEVLVPEGSEAESLKLWGKNHFYNSKGATVKAQGVTVEWDAENQEFVFNGTTTGNGDWKLVNPFEIGWEPGKKYTMTVTQVGGTATLGGGTGSTTYAWGIFQSNASKFVRGVTGNASFLEKYSFTDTAYELDAGRTHVLYFQCWRSGTVFDNYRVKIQIEQGNAATEWEPYRGVTVAIADAAGQTLYKGMNYIMTMPSGEVTIGQIEDTKTYIDRVAGQSGISSVEDLPDAVVTNAYDKDTTGYEEKKFLWNGSTSDNTAYFATWFIAVEPDTDYAFYGSDLSPKVRSICEYDADQSFIAGKSHQDVFTIHTAANTHFLRVCCYNGAENTLTVRKGTMATGYTPRHSYKIPGEVVAQDANAIDAYLPKHIYCAAGRTIELYNNQVCLQADKYHMKWVCPVGSALKRKFRITGTDALVGDYTLKLGIYNDRLEEVWAGSTTLHIVAGTISPAPGIVPIGDSLTNSKPWLAEVQSLFNKSGRPFTGFLGSYRWTLTDSDGATFSGGHEGRSGFTAQGYINGAAYSYGGETEPNIFWDGEKFSWSHYMEETGYAGMGVVNAVMIFLGTNGISNDNTANAGYIKQMVDTIQADQPNIKVFVCNTIYRSNQNGIGVQVGNDGYAAASGVWKYNEDCKVMDLMKRLDAMLAGYENLWMVNLALTHDSEYNFGAVETPVNPRAAQTELMPIESVHPQAQGYYQMADVMFSVLCAAFAE